MDISAKGKGDGELVTGAANGSTAGVNRGDANVS
jgi:hypothetical protein